MWSNCPEALYGQHGEADRDGRCPYCRAKIGPKMMRPGMDYATRQRLSLEQDPATIDGPTDDDYFDN